MTFLERLAAVTDRIWFVLTAAFGVVLGLLILLIAAEIGVRYFRLGSLPWLIEIVEYVMAGGTFLAAPWVLRQGAHVRVDVLLTVVSKRTARRLEQFTDLLGCALSGVLFYYGCIVVLQAIRTKEILYKSWWTPEWIVLLPVPIAFLLLFLEFVLRFLRVKNVVSDEIDPTKHASI